MKIVICDDSIEDMLKMEKLLNKYSDSCPDIHFVLEKYSDSERLYQQIQKKEPADIYLLDMVMPCKDGLISVPYSKIEYIENVSRTLDVHLTDGTAIRSIFIRKSFDQEIAILLEGRNFIQVHKSFLINLKFVSKLMPDNILMESGKRIPVSKTRAPGVKKDYLLFVSEQY